MNDPSEAATKAAAHILRAIARLPEDERLDALALALKVYFEKLLPLWQFE